MVSENPFYAFLEHQLTLLGEQDPLEVLGATAGKLRVLLDRDCWERRPDPGTWSPIEIVNHLRDMELVFGFRLRTILHDEKPRLMGISQDRWNESAGAGETPAEIVRDFEALRAVNLKRWRRVPDEQLGRVGIHDEAEIEISLELLRRIQAGHDLSHLEQLRERLQ